MKVLRLRMNKMFLFFLSFASVLVLSGCLQIPLGYTRNVDFPTNYKSKKYAITFSVDYLSDGDISIGRASQEKYIDWLKEDLQKSGAFSTVTYRSFTQKSNYHIHFLIHYSCMPVNEAAALGFLMGHTLCAIPMWINMYLDTSAILYLNGIPVYSPTTTEALRCYVWVPFLPFGLVWNQWWAWTTQEKKCCRFLIKEIIDYQCLKLQ